MKIFKFKNHYNHKFKFGDPRTQQLKLKKPIRFGAAVRTVDGDQGILGNNNKFILKKVIIIKFFLKSIVKA